MLIKDQHFLIDKKVLEKEISISDLSGKDRVIEIGAGTGILTRELAKKSGKLLVFEIDKKFESSLKKLESSNIKIIYDNALKSSWRGYNKIVSNLPYSLSEPVIMKAIESGIEELTLIVGENFKNILEKKQSKIGILADLFFNFHAVMFVDKSSFSPSPRVDSWLIKLIRKTKKNKGEEFIARFVSKRGKIKNALLHSFMEKGKTKNQSREIVKKLNIPSSVLEKPVGKITGKFIIRLKNALKDI